MSQHYLITHTKPLENYYFATLQIKLCRRKNLPLKSMLMENASKSLSSVSLFIVFKKYNIFILVWEEE
jgi:hypothetical protein